MTTVGGRKIAFREEDSGKSTSFSYLEDFAGAESVDVRRHQERNSLQVKSRPFSAIYRLSQRLTTTLLRSCADSLASIADQEARLAHYLVQNDFIKLFPYVGDEHFEKVLQQREKPSKENKLVVKET